MEVEVKQPNGTYAKAIVVKLTSDNLTVAYKDGLKKSDETVPYEGCRVLRKLEAKNAVFKIGDVIEVYIKKGDMHGWKKATIRDIKGQFAVVESLDEPTVTEIVALDLCRDGSITDDLSFEKLKHHSVAVSDDLRQFFERKDAFKNFVAFVQNVLVDFDSQNQVINIWACTNSTIRRAKAVSEFLIANARQRMILLNRKEQLNKVMQDSGLAESKCIEEFRVVSDLMGLAIGAQGSNISRCLKIDGIKDIIYSESPDERDVFIVKIYADNADAAEQARTMMDFVMKTIRIPREMVSRIIGKDGSTIQDIVDKTGVVRVQIGNDDNPNGGYETDYVSFIFTGTAEAVEHADLLIKFHSKFLREMQTMREDMDRKIQSAKPAHSQSGNPFLKGLSERNVDNVGGGRRGPRNNSFNGDRNNGNFRSRFRGPLNPLRRGGGPGRFRGNKDDKDRGNNAEIGAFSQPDIKVTDE